MSNTVSIISEASSVAEKLVAFMESIECPPCQEGFQIKEELYEYILSTPGAVYMVKEKIVTLYANRIHQLCEQYQVLN